MSRVALWLITAGLFFLAGLFGPYSPLPFIALLPLLLTALVITAGRTASWIVGSVLAATVIWAILYFALHSVFYPVLLIESGLCTLLYVVVPSPGGEPGPAR